MKINKLILLSVFVYMSYTGLINLPAPPNGINVESNLSIAKLNDLGVFEWRTWEKEPSTFVWQFAERETAYIVEGEVHVRPEGADQAVILQKGDLVTFEPGLRTYWEVKKPLKKYVVLEEDLKNKLMWKAAFKAKELNGYASR
jgi:uncharacterized protein